MKRSRLFLALVALFALPLAADVHPNTAGGFPTDNAFTVGEIDNVNLFNGALTVTLPIGQSYPVNAGFSYRLQLVYNANPWDNEVVSQFDPQLAQLRDFTAARPTSCSNAGLGWRLSLGQMNPPCQSSEVTSPEKPIYQDETGTDHVFYPTLHATQVPETPEPTVTNFFYSRDGSYLRLRKLTNAQNLLQGWEVEFPDGTVREHNANGRLTKIRDPFNNSLSVVYTNDAGAEVWTLTDSVGRMHKVGFTTAFATKGYPQLVSYVDLQTFGGARSLYELVYDSQQIGRACPHDYSRGDVPGALTVGVEVPLLSTIKQPDLSTYSMKSGYVTDIPDPVADSNLVGSRCTDHAGNLTSLRVPTGGSFQWTWQTYRFPTGSTTKKHAQRNSGVATRSVLDAGSLLGKWQYLGPEFPLFGNEIVNTVIDPLGHKTERYFVTQLGSPNGLAPGDKNDYGLPFTGDVGNVSRQKTGSNGAKLYLSSRVFENVNGTAVLRRSEYVRYERDEIHGTSQPDLSNINRRMAQSLTVFEDDPGRSAEVIQSNFDGLGHYRQAKEVNGSFPGIASRTKTAAYNPTRGTFLIDIATGRQLAGTHTFTMLPTSSAWQLEKPDSLATDQQAAGGTIESEMTELCYAFNAPVVVRQRTHRLDGATQSAADLLVSRGLSAAGNVTSESHYGGDSQAAIPAGGADLCNLALPALAPFQLNHTYSGGVRATSRYQGFTFYSLNQAIDLSTGLPSSSRDASDIATTYGYDAFGRLLTARPETNQGAWTQITYSRFVSPSTQASAKVERTNNGSAAGPLLAQEETAFDGLGRVSKERQLLPSGAKAQRNTTYDGAGNRRFVTEWFPEAGSPTGTTEFQGYDPFGRATKIIPPDGNLHAVTMSYVGTRQATRTVPIATAAGGAETSTSVTEVYDRFGRLVEVREGSGPAGATVSTFYDYDVGNRLKSVSTASAGVTQNRTFNYDRAGLLKDETHPEKGTATYSNFDARGHALRKQDGTTDLTYSFDKAERLTQIRETGGTQRVLKSFAFADANANFNDPVNGSICFDRKQGKLTGQSRFNYVTLFGSPFAVEIREAMNYCGRDGRLSRKTLENRVNGAATPNESFLWPNWAYDALGNVTTFAYPQCTHAACTAILPRTVQNSYTNGGLTQVGFPGSPGAYANSITYHPNGLVNQVVHANTSSIPSTWLTDTYGLDPKGMSRPASITTTASTGVQRWATGAYAYDGAGNIKAIGTHTFAYDKVLRLTTANLYLEPTASTTLRAQTFTYDAFGNLQAIGGSNGRSTPTHSATNRLSPNPTTSYDTQGNLIAWNGSLYDYDPFNLMWHYRTATAGDDWVYLYTADDERVWSYKADNTSLWTLRDAGAGVLREYTTAGGWQVESDYIYRGGQLLAAQTAAGMRHFHLDHLGTPRLVSNPTGLQAAYHVYYPYGEEATPFNQDTIRAKFTGHERDLANPGGPGDDLDYMHARHYSPLTGRFVSVDPTWASADTKVPQTWNRFSYVSGNPVRYTDPDGKNPVALAALAAGAYMFLTSGAANTPTDSTDVVPSDPTGDQLLVGALVGPTNAIIGKLVGAAKGLLGKLAGAAPEPVPAVSAPRVPRGGAGPVRVGQAGEAAVRAVEDIGPKTRFTVQGRTYISDGTKADVLSEVKNVANLSYTRQLRDSAAYAKATGRRFELWARADTKLSRPLVAAQSRGEVIMRNIP